MAFLCLVRIVFFHIFGHRGVNFGLSRGKRGTENGKLLSNGGEVSGERGIHPLRRFAPRPPVSEGQSAGAVIGNSFPFSVLTSSSLLSLGNSNKFDCSRLLAAFTFPF